MKSNIIKLLVASLAAGIMAISGQVNDRPADTVEFRNNFVDMREVADFQISEDGNGITLYLKSGDCYYWER